MNEAIKLAIEKGGYGKRYDDVARIYDCDGHDSQLIEDLAFLDPLFWKALGKALGLEGNTLCRQDMPIGTFVADGKSYTEFGYGMQYYPAWLYQWHRFIDHIAEGKDIDSFFKEVIEGKEGE